MQIHILLIGPTSVEGLYIASGTKRDGFHQAPLLSKILSSMLSGEKKKKVDKKYKWFHPEKKSYQGSNKRTSN